MRLFVVGLIIGATVFSCAPEKSNESVVEEHKVLNSESDYDSVLAKEYGADKYGMKSYVMAFLKKGPNRDLDSTARQEVFIAHMKNIERMAADGDLVLAGPFSGDEDLRGIYIFNVATIAEAEALTNTDPAIQSGYLIMDLKPWYGSAALMGVNDAHKRISENLVSEG